MTYAGLTTADKGALLYAKLAERNYVVLRDGKIDHFTIEFPRFKHHNKFNWEIVAIDHALAQIAEMESKQKELLSEKASEKGCLTNRDKWMQLWNESDEILARQFVQQEWYGTQWCVYMFSEEPISRHDKWEDAIQAAITALHSPYTEGETE